MTATVSKVWGSVQKLRGHEPLTPVAQVQGASARRLRPSFAKASISLLLFRAIAPTGRLGPPTVHYRFFALRANCLTP